MRHPAKYSDPLLPIFKDLVDESNKKMILDPFGGTGKLKDVFPNAIILDIEKEWASIRKSIVGDATSLPFLNDSFDVICTSPTYGNRMADSFIDRQPEKKYVRNTYTHALGKKLNQNNSGSMQWGDKYRDLHKSAWNEVYRVLKNGGMFICNISNHIRKGIEIKVSEWHKDCIENIGFCFIGEIQVKTRRNGMGENGKSRVDHEKIYVFKKYENNYQMSFLESEKMGEYLKRMEK